METLCIKREETYSINLKTDFVETVTSTHPHQHIGYQRYMRSAAQQVYRGSDSNSHRQARSASLLTVDSKPRGYNPACAIISGISSQDLRISSRVSCPSSSTYGSSQRVTEELQQTGKTFYITKNTRYAAQALVQLHNLNYTYFLGTPPRLQKISVDCGYAIQAPR